MPLLPRSLRRTTSCWPPSRLAWRAWMPRNEDFASSSDFCALTCTNQPLPAALLGSTAGAVAATTVVGDGGAGVGAAVADPSGASDSGALAGDGAGEATRGWGGWMVVPPARAPGGRAAPGSPGGSAG